MPGMFLKFNQPELWLLTGNVNSKRRLSGPSARPSVMQDQCNYSQCVFLLTFIMASTMQSGNEAKHVVCSIFNDISHFQCFVTAHKLILSLRHRHFSHSRVQPSLLEEDPESSGNRTQTKRGIAWYGCLEIH